MKTTATGLPRILPAWIKHDKQVLRFKCYFKESVLESPIENFRYYVEDGTLQVLEPKSENSGLQQGVFIKRHRVSKPNGGFYGPEDLRCGADITIYARVFRIVEADEFTHKFYKESGLNCGDHESIPLDPFNETKQREAEDSARPPPPEVLASKAYNDMLLGGVRINRKVKQYIENDGKVLRFYCYWDDTTRYGTRQYFLLHCFLADDTIEILEQHMRNSGRDPYPTFFKRGVLLKKASFGFMPGQRPLNEERYTDKDLAVGKEINVYGRTVFLYDADAFTRSHYQEKYGITLEKVDLPAETKLHVKLSYPPHVGIGCEDDSISNVINLIPKPQKIDLVRLMEYSHTILRYEARMMNNSVEDENRRFIIGMYPMDDTVAVWEIKCRNSGMVEGKFAERGKKKNPNTGVWFKPADFFVGAIVTISAMPFQILRADEYTLKHMEERPDVYPRSDVKNIIKKSSAAISAIPAGQKSINPDAFREVVARGSKIMLGDQEIITVLRAFASEDGSEIDLSQLKRN